VTYVLTAHIALLTNGAHRDVPATRRAR
jgi:hypothetical protein